MRINYCILLAGNKNYGSKIMLSAAVLEKQVVKLN